MTSKSRPADGARAGSPSLRVYEIHDGTWTWCYDDPAAGVELHSNTDYSSPDEAAAAARQAYPDVALGDDHGSGP